MDNQISLEVKESMALKFHINKLGLALLISGASLAHGGAGRVMIAWDAAPRTIDPRYAGDANAQYLADLVHCSLFSFDAQGRRIPEVALSEAEWLSPKKLHVKLRQDIHFSNGKKLDSSDVKATFESIINTTLSPLHMSFANVDKILAPSATSVEFYLKEPDAHFAGNLAIGILSKEQALGSEIRDFKKLNSCGLYGIKNFDQSSLVLGANPKAHQAVKNPEIEIKFIKDEKTRFAKLQRGELDLVQNAISRDVLQDIPKKYPTLKVDKAPGLKTTYVGFNTKDPALSKQEVREAIALAIDSAEIIRYVLQGYAIPAKSLLLPTDPNLSPKLSFLNPQLDQAKTLLDKAGFQADAKGRRLKLSLKTTTDTTRVQIARAIASQLKKIGIETVVESMEWGRFAADVEASRVQMWTLMWIGFKDPDIMRYAFATDSHPPKGPNRGFYSNPALDKLLSAAKQETKDEKRLELYQKASEIIDHDKPYAFLWHEEHFAVYRKDLKGFKIYADGRYRALAETGYF